MSIRMVGYGRPGRLNGRSSLFIDGSQKELLRKP